MRWLSADAPAWASATARLTATVLLPTPPLPEATAMTFLTPGMSCSGRTGAARRTMAPQVMSTASAPMDRTAVLTFRSISSLSGQAGVVSSMVNAILDPSIARSLTMLSVTMSRPSSGSCTVRRTSKIASGVSWIIGGRPLGMSFWSVWRGYRTAGRPASRPTPPVSPMVRARAPSDPVRNLVIRTNPFISARRSHS
jgi:hypothetical protein